MGMKKCVDCLGTGTVPRFRFFRSIFRKKCLVCNGSASVYHPAAQFHASHKQAVSARRFSAETPKPAPKQAAAFPGDDADILTPLAVGVAASAFSSGSRARESQNEEPRMSSGGGGDFGGGGASGDIPADEPVATHEPEAESCRREDYASAASVSEAVAEAPAPSPDISSGNDNNS